jgi:hypothetical protein
MLEDDLNLAEALRFASIIDRRAVGETEQLGGAPCVRACQPVPVGAAVTRTPFAKLKRVE